MMSGFLCTPYVQFGSFPTSCCCLAVVIVGVVGCCCCCVCAGSACALLPSQWGLRVTLWRARRISLRALAQLMVTTDDIKEMRDLLSSYDSFRACFCLVLPMEAGSGCRCGNPTSVCVLSRKTVLYTHRHPVHPAPVPILHPT